MNMNYRFKYFFPVKDFSENKLKIFLENYGGLAKAEAD